MQDRFKFRCGITISHYDDDGNDIETSLLVNNISIFNDGDVGFNRESLKEAVERKNLSEEEERTLWNSLDEYEVFEDWYQMPADFIEQCSGLNDKNNCLIWEGDICIPAKDVADKPGEVYRAESGAYFIKGIMKSGMNYDCNLYWHHYMYEVIGNIHENHDLIKE